MSTASHPTTEPLAVGAWGDDGDSDSKSERYLARRLAAASADYKGVAFTTFLLGAGVGILVWVACGVALEHWVVSGGLPRWARWTWLLLGLAAVVAAAIRWILPLVRYRVNLVYAARVIEREHPELHNDLVNTVLVKAHPEGNAATIVKSLERRAAKRLSAVPSDAVVDRSLAVRLAYALALLVGLACVYSLAAPKSMLTTTARLLAPWTHIVAPTRVRLEPSRLSWRMPGEQAVGVAAGAGGDVASDGSDPHDPRGIKIDAGVATLVRGRQLVVSSVIRGLRPDERPMIMVTPLLDSGVVDGVAVPWRVEMTRVGSEAIQGQRYAAVLPDAARGLDQSVSFTIQAGDARSEPVRMTLVDSPTLLVRQVRYEFPEYMQRESETVAWQGDLRAVEGTRVVISAESNQPLESAWIDFECDGSRDLKLKVNASDLTRATASFVMQMNPERTAAEHASYRLLFQPRGTALVGREQVETEKLEHRIEVQADLAPEISIEEPRESPARVPPSAPVTVRVRALDPDFGLARVGIETRVQGGVVQPEIVLPDSERKSAFSGVLQLVPERLGAGQGSRLEYRGVAVDTRPGQPNVTQTPWKVLQIDASAPPRPPEKTPPRAGEQKKPERDGSAGDATEKSRGKGDDSSEPGANQGDESRSDGDEGPGNTKSRDRQRDPAEQENRQGQESAAGQGEKSSGEEPAGGQPEAAGAQNPDERRQQSPERSGGQQQKNSQQKSPQQQNEPQQNEPQKNSGQQGEPQPGQQNGTASGSQQGGKQPQAGENKQPGSSQGQSGEAGGDNSSGKGSGGAGKSGSGTEPNGEQGDGKQGAGGQQGEAKQSGADRPGSGKAENRNTGGQSQSRQGQRNGQSQQDGGKQGDGQQQPRSAVASDGTNDGEAMERILDHRRQAGGDVANGMKSGKSEDGGDSPKETGGKKDGKAGETASKKGQPAGDESEAADGKQANGPSKLGTEGKQNGAQSSTEGQQGADGQAQEGKQGEGKQGEGKQGEGKQGEGKQGEGKQGEGKQGEGKQGEGKQGEGKQGEGKQGEGKQGEGKQGEGKQGEGKQGEGKQGEGKQGEGKQGEGEGAGESSEDNAQQKGGKTAASPAGQGAARPQGDPKQEGESGSKPSGQQAGGPPPEGASQSSPVGGGGWSEGAAAPQPGGPAAQGSPPSRETEWGQQDLENARNAADLAIEHLRATVESGRTDVLDELGWTRDQARAFLDRWETMRRQAESPDPQKRGEFERVLRSLGLRPAGVQSSRDVPADAKGGQAEGRRSRPPSDYRERFKAFLQGTSSEQGASGEQGMSSKPGAKDQ